MSEKILVIGAGMAGIMAARTLHDAGGDVTLLEARERLGGRTHTDSSLGRTVDLGAAWIHGPDGNPLTPLAEQLGVGMGQTDFVNRSGTAVQAYSPTGTPLNTAEFARGQHLADAAVALSDASILYQPPGREARSLKEWVQHGLPQPATMTPDEQAGFRYWATIRAEYNDNADWELIDWALGGRYVKLPGGDLLLHGGGYKALIDYLAAGLDVRLETAVTHITTTPNQVHVQTSNGRFSADRVIITLPLGVLKSGQIQFEPPLPAAKQHAIQRIGFGNYEKLALRFDQFYWPQQTQLFSCVGEADTDLFNAWLNLGFYSGTPLISVSHAGRRAREINRWSDDRLLAEALAVMNRLFGDEFGPIPAPQAVVRTNWQNDPFANGSYSFDQVGQQPNDRQTLAEPINQQLFFAGEATHPHFYATVHGAYETGVRAAREVAQAIRDK